MRAAVLLVALAVVAAACGDSSPPLAQTSTDRLELEVVVAPDPLVSSEPATFELHVTNRSDERALLTFDTTQRGDVALAIHEVEVYRWAELRAFSNERTDLSLVPGQRVTFALEQSDLPVAPGEYELVVTVTGLPKLRTVRTPVSVVAPDAIETPAPAPPPEALPEAYERLVAAVETTVDQLALPIVTGLVDTGAVDAEGAVVREHVTDALARLTFAEVLLAAQQVGDGDGDGDVDVEAARALAVAQAAHVGATVAELRSVSEDDLDDLVGLLEDHIDVVADVARVIDAGGGDDALEAPRTELEELAGRIGPLVAVTAGGEIGTDPSTRLFIDWSDAIVRAVEQGARTGVWVRGAHEAATTAVEPVGLDIAEAYADHLDLEGFSTAAAVIRQEVVSGLVDEVLLLATALDVDDVQQRAEVMTVLDDNADELAAALGSAPPIDATEEQALRELVRRRAATTLAAAASPGGNAEDQLARIDDQLAQTLGGATDGALAPDAIGRWLEAQRRATLEALRAVAP